MEVNISNPTQPVNCYSCHRVRPRIDTLIIESQKGRFRLCKNCYTEYEARKLNDQYKTTKENVKGFQIEFTDAYQIMKEKEEFLKKLKK